MGGEFCIGCMQDEFCNDPCCTFFEGRNKRQIIAFDELQCGGDRITFLSLETVAEDASLCGDPESILVSQEEKKEERLSCRGGEMLQEPFFFFLPKREGMHRRILRQ